MEIIAKIKIDKTVLYVKDDHGATLGYSAKEVQNKMDEIFTIIGLLGYKWEFANLGTYFRMLIFKSQRPSGTWDNEETYYTLDFVRDMNIEWIYHINMIILMIHGTSNTEMVSTQFNHKPLERLLEVL